MRLLIVACGDPLRWYAGLVGQCVPFKGDAGCGEYRSLEPSGLINFVQHEDAQLIADEGDPAVAGIAALADQLEAEAEDLLRQAAVRRHGAADLRRSLVRLGEG